MGQTNFWANKTYVIINGITCHIVKTSVMDFCGLLFTWM